MLKLVFHVSTVGSPLVCSHGTVVCHLRTSLTVQGSFFLRSAAAVCSYSTMLILTIQWHDCTTWAEPEHLASAVTKSSQRPPSPLCGWCHESSKQLIPFWNCIIIGCHGSMDDKTFYYSQCFMECLLRRSTERLPRMCFQVQPLIKCRSEFLEMVGIMESFHFSKWMMIGDCVTATVYMRTEKQWNIRINWKQSNLK